MSMASVDRKLRTYCHRCNIQEKSLHKIRKTFISTLIESRAVSIKYVQECVGHASAQTTYKSYYFDRKSKNVTEKGMEEALTHKV